MEATGVTPQQLAAKYPRLYHMAEMDSLESIFRYGLLGTEALLDLFEVQSEERAAILTRRRGQSVDIQHPEYGKAVIRDQKPLIQSKLEKSLIDCSFQEWLRMLNSRVFFWLCERRLRTLMCASEYRAKSHLVLELDTLKLATDL